MVLLMMAFIGAKAQNYNPYLPVSDTLNSEMKLKAEFVDFYNGVNQCRTNLLTGIVLQFGGVTLTGISSFVKDEDAMKTVAVLGIIAAGIGTIVEITGITKLTKGKLSFDKNGIIYKL